MSAHAHASNPRPAASPREEALMLGLTLSML
jgi:hypothetical protein